MAAPENENNPLFPMTLDLRLPPPGHKAPIESKEIVS
jgi:hypothetical protein